MNRFAINGAALNESAGLVAKTKVSSALTSIGSVAAFGVRRFPAAAAIGATGGVVPTVLILKRLYASIPDPLQGASTLAGRPVSRVKVAADLPASSTLVFSTVRTARAQATLAGAAQVSQVGVVRKRADTAPAARGAIAAFARKRYAVQVTLAGSTSVFAVFVIPRVSAAVLSGGTSIAAGFMVSRRAAATLTGVASTEGAIAVSHDAGVVLAAGAGVSAGTALTTRVSRHLAGATGVSAATSINRPVSAALAGIGGITPTEVKTTRVYVSAGLPATAATGLQPQVVVLLSAALPAQAQVVGRTAADYSIRLSLEATSTLVAAPRVAVRMRRAHIYVQSVIVSKKSRAVT